MQNTQGGAPVAPITRAAYALDWGTKAGLTKNQATAFMFAVRESFLWNRDYAWLAPSYVANNTNLSRTAASRALQELVRMGILYKARREVYWAKNKPTKTCFVFAETFAVSGRKTDEEPQQIIAATRNKKIAAGRNLTIKDVNNIRETPISPSLRSGETRAREICVADMCMSIELESISMPTASVSDTNNSLAQPAMPDPSPQPPSSAAPPSPQQQQLQATQPNPDRALIFGIPADIHDALFAIDPNDLAIHRRLPKINKLLSTFGHDRTLQALTWAKDNATIDAVALAASVLIAGNTPWESTETCTSRTNIDTVPGSPEARTLIRKLLDVRVLLTLNEPPSVAMKNAERLFVEQRNAISGLVPEERKDEFILSCVEEVARDKYWSKNLTRTKQLLENFGTFSGVVLARMKYQTHDAQRVADVAAKQEEMARKLAAWKAENARQANQWR